MNFFKNSSLMLAAVGLIAIGSAQQANATGDGATVINEFGCGLSPNVSGLPGFLFTNETHTVITPSGNTVLSCRFDIPAGFAPASAIVAKDFLCGTFLGVADKSQVVVSPGGQATLTCQVKHP